MPEKCVKSPEQDCLCFPKMAVLEHRVEDLESWRLDSKKFHNDFYDWQREQIAKWATLDAKIVSISENIEKLVTWKSMEQEKPGRLVDKIKENVIWAVIGAFSAFILAKIGL